MNAGNKSWLKKILSLIKGEIESTNSNISSLSGNTLKKDGSNATATTTSAIFEAAAGGGSDSYVIDADKTQILLKDQGDSARKYTLGKFLSWLLEVFGKNDIVFNNVAIKQGINGSKVYVVDKYFLSQNNYNKTETDSLLIKKANATALASLGTRVETLEDKVNTTQTRTGGRAIRQTCVFEASSSASINTIRKNYNTTIYPYDICVIINVSSSNITISGFQTSSGANDSYTISPYRMVMFIALGQNSMYVKHNE